MLIQDYQDGGLKAPDIFSMNKAWKLSWITKLQNENSGEWKNPILNRLDKVGGLDYLLSCNFEVGSLAIQLNEFWSEVFEYYSEVMSPEIKTKQDIRIQKINNNKNIKIGKKSLYMESLVRTNLDEIDSWFSPDGKPYDFNRLNLINSQLSWFQYIQIINAIPKQWKDKLKQPELCIRNFESDKPVFLKQIYKQTLLDRQKEPITGCKKWTVTENHKWSNTFILARKMSKETKLQTFQYKILHRILPTNKRKFEQKLSNDPHCSDCPQVVESIEHMLYECKNAKALWDKLVDVFQRRMF